MGATRRLDHYDASLGWQGLFIVSGIGVAIIGLGIAVQVVQLVYSVWKRHELRDTTGDPWDGRTLEWSVASPAPYYNFATLPHVTTRDAFWEMKRNHKSHKTTKFEPFELPKSSPMGMIIAAGAFVIGFAIIWHIWWLVVVGFVFTVGSFLYRTTQEDTEFTVTKDMLSKPMPGEVS